MSQRPGIIYNIISYPLIYKIVQKLMSGTSFREKIIRKNVKFGKVNVLDIGCGPAEILNYIPLSNYYGFDIDKRHINYARKKFNRNNCHFFCKKFTFKDLKKLPKFDYVVLFGILHHLKNEEAKTILKLCRKVMKKKGVLLTEDPIFTKNQNIIAKFFIKNDRGANVRTKNEYLKLAKQNFKKINAKISNQSFIPYTWFTMTCYK